jgi:hypothetical protein
MSNQYLKLRRSNVQGKTPTTESIDFGEIALNTYDGLAYMKKSGSNGIEVVPIGYSSGSFSGNFTGTFTGSLQGTASWARNALTASYTPGLSTNGTQYYVPVWTDTGSLGTSSLYDDGSVVKSVYGGNDIGLKLDFANNVYRIGGQSLFAQISDLGLLGGNFSLYSPNAGIDNGILIAYTDTFNAIISNVFLGDFNNTGNGVNFRIDDFSTKTILTQYQGNDIGLKLNFSSSKYELGQLTGGNQTKLIVDDIARTISITGSLIAPSITGSLHGTASWARNAISASHTLTASFAPAYLPLTGGTINGNVTVNGTASIAFLNVTIESASVIYSSGSNQLGDATNDTQTLIGTVRISGSQQITGSLYAPHITGSLEGTASWARNAQTASYVLNAISASHAETASYAVNATNAINAATASNILGGKAPHVPYFITDSTLATSSIYQSGSTSVIINQDANTTANPEALYVWQPHPTSINVISGKGNLDNYLQLNIQNTNQGGNASSDIVATANNGNETTNYIDMGINSENYNGFLGGPNDAYLYNKGENLWIGNYSDGKNVYFFNSSSEAALITLTPSNTVDIPVALNAPDITGSLEGTASWAKNVISASHAVNSDFAGYAQTAGIAANGGVTQIIAGSGVSLVPTNGLGNVTVIATGVGGVTILSGSNVTESFSNSNTWTFTHNLGIRTPVISVFDSSYNQVIPESIQLIDTASAIITFPTLESGFAVASVGGVTGNALSSSYSLFATYADTASFAFETDPVFVAKSASLATTGSNVFRGTQTISGSLILVNGATGSLLGTASYALNALSSSYAQTASYSQNLVVSGSISTVDYIDFNTTTNPSHLEGRVHWDDAVKTLQLDTENPNFSIDVGHQSVVRVYNNTGADIQAGKVVYINGAQGNTPTVATASWEIDPSSAGTIGFAATTISGSGGNRHGYVITNGLITNVNTNGIAVGSRLFLSSSGAFTDVAPDAPLHEVRLGVVVVNNATTGVIYVNVVNGFELTELHDVRTTTESNGDLLVYSSSLWTNSKALTGSYSITGSLTISGSSTFTNIGPAVFTGSVGITGSVNMAGSIIPVVSSSFSLGSIDNPWKEIFLKSGSISIESDVPGNPATVISNSDGNILLSAGGMQLLGSGSFNAATGSFGYISGSLTHVGTLTQVGDTVITGSLKVSGSLTEIGNTVLSGSLTLSSGSSLNLNNGFYVDGNKQYNYGQFSSTQTQSGSANTAYSMTYDTVVFSQGVSLVSGSRIQVAHKGLYDLQFQAQLGNTANTAIDFDIWFAYTGSNIANSNTNVTLNRIPGSNGRLVAAWNYAILIQAGDYVEIKWNCNASTGQLQAIGTQTGPVRPATPSVIATVTQIA